ncbi:MAG TPA: hypothetical protein VM889_02565 [Candidatus Thermoplasmatota archaeon]|nr:hypothetical protein [Candidatus Thermoplasmatota archaeon]
MAKRDKSIEELDRELAALEEELKALQGGSRATKAAAPEAPRENPADAPKKSLLGRFRKDEAPSLAPVASAADAPAPAPAPAPAAGAWRWAREGRVSRRIAKGEIEPVRVLRVLDRDGRVVSEAAAPDEPARSPRVAALASRVPSFLKRKRSGGGDG